MLVTKGSLQASNSFMAQGGIAAAVGPDDDPELHLADTLAVGRGLADPAAAAVLVREGVDRVADLGRLGVQWDRDENGRPQLAREGGHSRNRIFHADGTATGARSPGRSSAGWRPIPASVSSSTPPPSGSSPTETAARARGSSATTSSSRCGRG